MYFVARKIVKNYRKLSSNRWLYSIKPNKLWLVVLGKNQSRVGKDGIEIEGEKNFSTVSHLYERRKNVYMCFWLFCYYVPPYGKSNFHPCHAHVRLNCSIFRSPLSKKKSLGLSTMNIFILSTWLNQKTSKVQIVNASFMHLICQVHIRFAE